MKTRYWSFAITLLRFVEVEMCSHVLNDSTITLQTAIVRNVESMKIRLVPIPIAGGGRMRHLDKCNSGGLCNAGLNASECW